MLKFNAEQFRKTYRVLSTQITYHLIFKRVKEKKKRILKFRRHKMEYSNLAAPVDYVTELFLSNLLCAVFPYK